ncbi:MAG: fructose-6-phosphate aldolase [Ignavibacteriales bacterium]|nr:fructose-6-phosphate aldolase [Ignavibacteriales bacterium]
MKLFLDTASVQEIRDAAAMGLVDGVTTNPSLVAKEQKPFNEILKEICSIIKGDVSAEVTAIDVDGMLKQGRELAKVADNVIVKVPLIKEGLVAVQKFKSEGIRCNVTLCFSPSQALLAAKAGAYIISPFVGRLDDISEDGMNLIQQILQIYNNYGFETQVLVASCRHPLHIVDSAMMGAHIATMPFKVYDQLIKHPLTDIGLQKFLEDWKKAK